MKLKSLISGAATVLRSDPRHQAKRAEQFAADFRWEDSARHFYRSARAYHDAGEHLIEAQMLRRAAQAYEGTQTWRTAGDSWLRTARAGAGHPQEPPEVGPRDPVGEAYMWAGYTFFWAEQHYDSWRAHTLAGQAFEAASDWSTAERCYMYGAISKARAFASLGAPNRFVHHRYEETARVDLVEALVRVTKARRAKHPTERSAAIRSHIDALFMSRRALEEAGNDDESRALYVLEQDARLELARIDGTTWQWFSKLFYKLALGYGEGLTNLAIVSLFLFGLLFPSLYLVLPELKGADGFSDYLFFSLASVSTLDANGMEATKLTAWIAQLEFLVGLTVFGLLVSVVVRLTQR